MKNTNFGQISQIDPQDSRTWKNRVFVTFDIEWASDEVLEDSIRIVEDAQVEATWFATHDTVLLDRIRSNPRFELGIHPNFNKLLFDGSPTNGKTPREIVENLLQIVPNARSVRSHSMTQSSPILDLFKELGITHDCNTFISPDSGMSLSPWRHWNGVVRIPCFWEDDVHLIENWSYDLAELRSRNGIKVFNFHPTHIALNTGHIDDYIKTRPIHRDFSKILEFRRQRTTSGTRDRIDRLLASQ